MHRPPPWPSSLFASMKCTPCHQNVTFEPCQRPLCPRDLFDLLPDELLLHIMCFLPARTLLDCVSLLNRRCCLLIQDDSLWFAQTLLLLPSVEANKLGVQPSCGSRDANGACGTSSIFNSPGLCNSPVESPPDHAVSSAHSLDSFGSSIATLSSSPSSAFLYKPTKSLSLVRGTYYTLKSYFSNWKLDATETLMSCLMIFVSFISLHARLEEKIEPELEG